MLKILMMTDVMRVVDFNWLALRITSPLHRTQAAMFRR